MRYIFAFVKIVILCLLILISGYQTGKLWFEDTSDRNFFYNGTDSGSNVADQAGLRNNFILPLQVGVFIGTSDLEYTVIGSGASSYDSIVSSALDVTRRVMESGTKIPSTVAPEVLWEDQHILLVLPFEYTGDDLRRGFGLTEAKVMNVDTISTIYIVPADQDHSSLAVYLEDSRNDLIHKYMISKEALTVPNEVLNHYLNETQSSDDNTAYISTLKNQLPNYSHTILLPRANGDIQYHKNIFWEIPYVSDGVIDEEGVRSMTRTFFDNPDVLSAVLVKDEIRLASGNVSVRYNTQGILEYELIEEDRNDTDLTEAVSLSKQFLSLLEQNSVTEFYLEDYRVSEDSITIYYNLAYNGFPVIMSDAAKEQYEMDYSVEVEVSGQKVVAFRSMIRSIPERLPQFDDFDMPYGTALDKLVETYGVSANSIDDMHLGYLWEEDGSAMTIHWVITIEGETYFIEVEG